MYYLRTRPAVDAIKFTVDQQTLGAAVPQKQPSTPERPTGNSFVAFLNIDVGIVQSQFLALHKATLRPS
jgi:hypothetical protein